MRFEGWKSEKPLYLYQKHVPIFLEDSSVTEPRNVLKHTDDFGSGFLSTFIYTSVLFHYVLMLQWWQMYSTTTFVFWFCFCLYMLASSYDRWSVSPLLCKRKVNRICLGPPAVFMWSNTSQSLHIAQVTNPGLAIATCSGPSPFRPCISRLQTTSPLIFL